MIFDHDATMKSLDGPDYHRTKVPVLVDERHIGYRIERQEAKNFAR